MDTKAWGSVTWKAMFFIACGYQYNKTPRKIKDPQYKLFFESIGNTLPCFWCRDSYKQFFKEVDIDKYFGKPHGLMRFVYDMKNKVNEKLIKQENEVIKQKKEELKKATTEKERQRIKKEIKDTRYTKKAPPFPRVVAEYEKHRATCSKKLKSCRKK